MNINTPQETQSTPDEAAQPSPPRKPSRLLLSLAALWAAVVVAIWFAFHPPFQVEFPLYPSEINSRIAPALLRFLLDGVLLGLCTLASWAVGAFLLELTWPGHKTYLTLAERFIFSSGLGLGFNIMAVLGLGLLGGANAWIAYGLPGLELLLLVRYRGAIWERPAQLWRDYSGWRQSAPRWEKWLGFWLLALAILTILMTFAPPLSWDSLMYHLEAVRYYVAAGRIEFLPRIGQSNFPFGAEMLFLWGMLLHGEGLAQGFSWLYGLLGAGACLVFARRFFANLGTTQARQAGLLAGAIYLSSYHVWLLMTWAYTDLMLAFYALLAAHAFWLALENRGRAAWGLAFLGGLMAGFSCGGKYTGILAAAGLVLGGLVFTRFQKSASSFGNFIQASIAYSLGGALSFAPWLIRNFFFAGNPVAPFYGGIRGWDAEEVAFLITQDGGVSLTPAVIFGRPFQMILTGRDGSAFDATVSPLTLALLPLAIWAAIHSRTITTLWLTVGITYLGWLVGIKQSAGADHTRILAATFPLVALIAAYAVFAFWQQTAWKNAAQLLRLVSAGIIGVCLVASLFGAMLYVVANNPLLYHFGLQTRSEWAEAQLGEYYRAARFVNSNLPTAANVFMACEPRAYYFERPTLPDHNMCGQFFTQLGRYPTPEAFQAALGKNGASYFLLNENLLNYLLRTPENIYFEKAKQARQLLDTLEARKLFQKVYQEPGSYAIYKIN